MSAADDENLAEGSLISHLLELRDRLMRAVISVGVLFVTLRDLLEQLFTLIAMPLMARMPKGTSMIATSVVAPVDGGR